MKTLFIINIFCLILLISGNQDLCAQDNSDFIICQTPPEIIFINRTDNSEEFVLTLHDDVTIGPSAFSNLNISKLDIVPEEKSKYKKKFNGFGVILQQKAFEHLASLKKLILEDVNIKMNGDVFSAIGSLTTLKYSSSDLREIPSATILEFLPELEELSFSGSNISAVHVNAFVNMKKLKSLDLSQNEITTIEDEWTNGLSELRILDLSKNSLSTIPSLDGLTKLEILDISYNFEMTRIEPHAFKSVPELNILKFRDNNLHSLYSGIFDDIPLVKTLKLSGNKINNIKKDIFNKLTFLENLQLSSNHIETIQTNAFSGLKLSDLNLERNNIKTVDVGTYNDLKVRRLKLKFNQIMEVRPSAFNGLNAMQVDLGHNKIKFIGSGDFRGLITDELDLNDNEIVDIASDAFNNTIVQRVSLVRNHLETEDKVNWGLAESVKMETLKRSTDCRRRSGRCWI